MSAWLPRLQQLATNPLALGLAALGALAQFWRTHIVWGAPETAIRLGNWDLFTAYLPRTTYAFGRLSEGELPLWNPFQLVGMPQLAVPATGLFYPANWIYLVLDVPVGIELQYLLHAFLGGLGMFGFARSLGMGRVAGLCGAACLVLSGFGYGAVQQPVLFAGFSWLPFLLWQTVSVVQGRRHAAARLSLVVALAWLTGANEVFFHGAIGAAAVAVAAGIARFRRERRVPLVPLLSGLGALVLGFGLAGLQLLPTLELVADSVRAPGALTALQASRTFPFPARSFAQSLLGGFGPSHLGYALLAVGPFAFRRHCARPIVVALALVGVLAGALMVSGPLARAYSEIPVLGSLFRRTLKFGDLFALCGALVSAAGVHGALMAAASRRDEWKPWRDPCWVAALALTLGVCLLGRALETSWLEPGVALAAVAALGAPRRAFRLAAVAVVVLLHAFTLFWREPWKVQRPIERSGWVERGRPLFELAAESLALERLYLGTRLGYSAHYSPSLGSLHRVPVLGDYQPLMPARTARFFDVASGGRVMPPFDGRFSLGPRVRWRLIDLAGTGMFAVRSGESAVLRARVGAFDRRLRLMPSHPSSDGKIVDIFEATAAPPPRAFLARRARVVADPEAVLKALVEPDLDLRETVVLETPLGSPLPEYSPHEPVVPAAEVVIDRYEPERVEVDVESGVPGVLVLSDLLYPGWRVQVDGEPAELLRADHLFRGVPLAAGHHRVVFEFAPTSFRIGAGLSSASALAWLLLVGLRSRRARRA